MIEALCATADNDQRFPRKWGDPGLELAGIHKAAFAQLLQLSTKWKRVEVVAHWYDLGPGPEKKEAYCVGHRARGKRRCYNLTETR